MQEKEKILITSALPYANGPIHFGHIAGAFLPADCFARFQRLQGADVLYLSGSDEYGVAITMSAELAGRTPRQQVDLFHEINQAFLKRLNISFDHYSRTTWKGHAATVQQFFLDLVKNGHVEEKVTLQLFSEKENRFLADRYVQGTCPKCGFAKARGDECPSCGASYEATDLLHPVSKATGSPLLLKETKHWFLRFDHFKEDLQAWIQKKNWKPNVLNFALAYIKELKPRAITRDSDWGIPVPLEGAEGKVLYVWFDAPIGYISAAKEWAELQGDPKLWERYWLDEKTRYVEFIGKDNIPFHAVFFPAMQMGQDIPYKLVDDLPANEFYNLEGKQFSKSDGWYIDLDSFFTHFQTEQIRYAIASNAPETQDSEFTWKDFQSRCNADLVGKYGNFVHRVLVFIQQKTEGKIPQSKQLDPIDSEFQEKMKSIVSECEKAYGSFQLRKACQHVMELAQAGNVYFDAKKPWKAAKDPLLTDSMYTTLRCCLECIQLLALVSYPVIPEAAEKIAIMLGLSPKDFFALGWKGVIASPLQEGLHLPEPQTLFAKVEDDVIAPYQAALTSKAASVPKEPIPVNTNKISIDDVKKLDLRVVSIVAVERVPKSKKLLKVLVDLGFEKRTVVAGIGEGVQDIDSFIGRKVILVANLAPASLCGVESQGMLLAAKGDMGLELPIFSLSSPGDLVS
ncbi:MAG: methionine--tRNA ligase [Rhabdochlamydiaceae bacterium]|nr:methionine--tRNA ligase [Rhabdochlamydiaceae bacterium]